MKNFEVYGYGAPSGSEIIMDVSELEGHTYITASREAYDFFDGNSLARYEFLGDALEDYPGAPVYKWNGKEWV
jgi:hypothetical protein